MKVYDGHSHLGKDSFYPLRGDNESFISLFSKLEISEANIMPVPCPEYFFENTSKRSLVWEFSKGKFNYFNQIKCGGEWINSTQNPINPYKEFNEILRNNLTKVSAPFLIHFVPLVHPILDQEDYLDKLLSDSKIIGIKIHGLACGITPKQMPPRFLRQVSRSRVPIIVHTDYIPLENTPFNYLRKNNKAIDWVNLFEDFGIRGYITHGAAICFDTLSKINESKNHVVAIGPDLWISKEPENLLQSGDYLSRLIEQCSPDKLVFDLDFPYNIDDLSSLNLDLEPINRLRNRGINSLDLEKILYSNSKNFFNFRAESK